MQTLYKLTRPNLTTYGGYQWTVGEERTFFGEGPLCGPGWCHAYLTPELAVLLNPIHADYRPFRLFEAEGAIGARDRDLKVGCSRFVLRREIEVPVLSHEQRVVFAIICAQALPTRDPRWREWAENWLSGRNRSLVATEAAARAAAWAAGAAWATEAAARAARAAALAAEAAWAAAWAAEAAWATEAAAWAARAAAWAARAAALAAEAAAWAAEAALRIDLPALAHRAYLWRDPLASNLVSNHDNDDPR